MHSPLSVALALLNALLLQPDGREVVVWAQGEEEEVDGAKAAERAPQPLWHTDGLEPQAQEPKGIVASAGTPGGLQEAAPLIAVGTETREQQQQQQKWQEGGAGRVAEPPVGTQGETAEKVLGRPMGQQSAEQHLRCLQEQEQLVKQHRAAAVAAPLPLGVCTASAAAAEVPAGAAAEDSAEVRELMELLCCT